MSDKYELTQETINFDGIVLHRIRALKDFGSVYAGDLGGYIQSKKNLSQEDTCWVYDEARVYGSAQVSGDAHISGKVRVFENARVYGYAMVSGLAWVYGSAQVYGEAQISGYIKLYDNMIVY